MFHYGYTLVKNPHRYENIEFHLAEMSELCRTVNYGVSPKADSILLYCILLYITAYIASHTAS